MQIVARENALPPELDAQSFTVRIDGRQRNVLMAERLHIDDGQVVRGRGTALLTGGTPECAFGFRRTSERLTAHYVLGVEPIDGENRRVQITMIGRAGTAPFWAWRLRTAAPPKAP